MITFTVEDGRVLAEIPDSHGEAHAYAVRPWSGLDTVPRSYELERLDTGDVYVLRTVFGRSWNCTCKAFRFGKVTPASCKHCLAVADLDVLARLLAGRAAETETTAVELESWSE